MIENVLIKYAPSYITYVKYPRIILARKYEFSFMYVTTFGLTKKIHFTACIYTDLGQLHVEPVIIGLKKGQPKNKKVRHVTITISP